MKNTYSSMLKRDATDEWFTPKEYVEQIVPYLLIKGYEKILCPFDKQESEFVKVLTDHGFKVTFSHIETGTDFFDINNLADFDAIVSNPPFSKRTEIFETLFNAGIPFAMISNFNGLFDSKGRWELFKNNSFELLIPKGRMKFFNRGCIRNPPSFQSIWVCKGICGKQIEFMK